MFNLLTMLDELFTTQWREIAAVFVLSCCVFTQFAIIGKCLTTLITAVNLFIIILFTITFIILNLIYVTLACEDPKSKLVDVVTVADADDEDRVGKSLLQIL